MATYKLSIITPHGKIFDNQVEALSVPGVMGSFSVLARHAPIVALIKEGQASLKQNNVRQEYTIGAGILEVNKKGETLLLTNKAERK